jgi:hypothetical protein
MARSSKISLATRRGEPQILPLAEQLFAIATRSTADAASQFLPKKSQVFGNAIRRFQSEHAARLAVLQAITVDEPKKSHLLTPVVTAWRNITTKKYIATAAVMLIAVGSTVILLNPFAEDSILIEDESGHSALHNEFTANAKSLSLRVMRKRKKIGEITVAQGSRLRVVKASNGESFRSEMAFAGTEADFKLKYKGRASVIVNNGPFKAKVRMAQGGDHDIHLRFKEMGSPRPVGEPQFEIEVIKGNVQIAEVDDENDFEQYKAGEKAIFSFTDSDSESL